MKLPCRVSPRVISAQTAARMLMSRDHIVILAAAAIPMHVAFVASVCNALPGECHLLMAQVNVGPPAPDRAKFFLGPAVSGRPNYLMQFVPDTPICGLAVTLVTSQYGGAEAVARLVGKAPGTIIMLPHPGDDGPDRELETAYSILIEGMRAVAEGRAIDTVSN
jgi:hypothetical protein